MSRKNILIKIYDFFCFKLISFSLQIYFFNFIFKKLLKTLIHGARKNINIRQRMNNLGTVKIQLNQYDA